MRIRKRTPARAASPGPAPARVASRRRRLRRRRDGGVDPHALTCRLPFWKQQERPQEQQQQEEEEETKVSLLGVGDQEDDQVPVASKNSAMDVPKPEPEPEPQGAGAPERPARCSRNDGKQWRCKSAAVPGYVFCDRHIAWSTRKRKRRAKKNHASISEPTKEEPAEEENEEDAEEAEAKNLDETGTTPNRRCNGSGDDGFFYYGGFQPGSPEAGEQQWSRAGVKQDAVLCFSDA